MRTNRTSTLSLLLTALLLPGLALAQAKSIEKVNGAIQTDAGVEYGSLETVNGAISVARGARAQGVETVNGGIQIGDQAQLASVETVNGGINAGREVVVFGDVETVNGGVSFDANSNIAGSVETVNGGIHLTATDIGNSIETVNGDISLLQGTRLKGDLIVRKPSGSWFSKSREPRIVIGADSVVEGELIFEREVELRVAASAKIGKVTGATVLPLE